MSTKASAQVALDMARQTIVLLQNKGNILPLQKGKEKIAVIGPNANNEPMMWGNYNGTPNHTVTILDGIKAKQKNLIYLPGCDLTNDKVMESHLATECVAPDGKKGLKGTFWNNIGMEGKTFTTEYYTKPVNVTTAGMHVFAPNLPIEDFSAKYETTFTPKEAGEYVVNVESTGHFELYVNGEKKFTHHIWRATPTRTVLKAEKGQKFQIEVRFQTVKTWGASMKIDVARELPIDYQETIAKLKGIDKVIFCGGIAPSLEGEEMPVNIDGFKGGDRTNIELPKVQREFLKALKAAGKQVIYVNGKLSVTFYKNSEQLPDYEDYSMKGRTYRYFNDALFPFGYGQSYTTFEIGEAKLEGQGTDYQVTIPVTNTGKRNGTEIVQLYIRDLSDKEGPLKSLRGFQRIEVKAGQTATATISLDAKSFEFWDAATNTMRTKPGQYEILYGTSSLDKDLKRLTITY